MGNLYFGGPLDTIRDIITSGFVSGENLKSSLLEAMLDARNSVGLNRRFKPAVLVIEKPSNTNVFFQRNNLEVKVIKNFLPLVKEIFLVKIDFKSPKLVKVAGTVSPQTLLESGSHSTRKRSVR